MPTGIVKNSKYLRQLIRLLMRKLLHFTNYKEIESQVNNFGRYLELTYAMNCQRKEMENWHKKIYRTFCPIETNLNLSKIGDKPDGAYVVPDLPVNFFVSLGIGNNFSFEKKISEKFKICGVDQTILSLHRRSSTNSLKFLECRLSNDLNPTGKDINQILKMSLKSLGLENLSISKEKISWALKIDVEGSEWGNLVKLLDSPIGLPDLLIGEFHHLLYTEKDSKNVEHDLEFLQNNYQSVTWNGNNFSLWFKAGEIAIYDIIEATFVRKQLIPNKGKLNAAIGNNKPNNPRAQHFAMGKL